MHEEIRKSLDDNFDKNSLQTLNSELKSHLAVCKECTQYYSELTGLKEKTNHLAKVIKPPVDYWLEIFTIISKVKSEAIKQQEALEEIETEKILKETEEIKKNKEEKEIFAREAEREKKQFEIINKLTNKKILYPFILSVVVLIAYLMYLFFFSQGESWEIKKYQLGGDDSPQTITRLSVGGVIETNQITRLKVLIPDNGELAVDPETNIKRVATNKIQLMQGAILVSYPNDILTIEVPGAEIAANTFNNKYKIKVQKKGRSILQVMTGWVKVIQADHEMLVLPNHFCDIIADSGIGLPYHKNSKKELIELINDYCFKNPNNEQTLISILTDADTENSVTLWNLLKVVNPGHRSMVVNTIYGLLGGLPEGVDREGLKVLNPEMMKRLIEFISANT